MSKYDQSTLSSSNLKGHITSKKFFGDGKIEKDQKIIELENEVNEHIRSLCEKLNLPMAQKFESKQKSVAFEKAFAKEFKGYLICRYKEFKAVVKTKGYDSKILGEIEEQLNIIEKIIKNKGKEKNLYSTDVLE